MSPPSDVAGILAEQEREALSHPRRRMRLSAVDPDRVGAGHDRVGDKESRGGSRTAYELSTTIRPTLTTRLTAVTFSRKTSRCCMAGRP